MVFMVLSGTNFVIHYYLPKKQFHKISDNEEYKFFLSIIFIIGITITSILFFRMHKPFEESFREGFFQVISIVTCTGYSTADYLQWPAYAWLIIFFAMFLREWFTRPVIVLSVRNSEDDIIKALDNGANDYLTKPFRTGELLARIRAAMRTTVNLADVSVLDFGSLNIDLTSHLVRKNKEIIKLTATEFALLRLLAVNNGRVLTHQHILREVWGRGYIEQTQYLRVFIAQLRKKIEDNPSRPALLITESGIGYRFGEPS
jgi:DNA-binding response OmpR family regulator